MVQLVDLRKCYARTVFTFWTTVVHTRPTTEQGGNAVDMYSGGARFESLPGHCLC
jgi:hypothetical protein